MEKALSRRNFLAGAGSVAAAGALAGCGDSGSTTTTTNNSKNSDADVLNFALNLEYLEASFYLYAATGKGLNSADMTPGAASSYQTVGTVVTNSTVQAVPNLTTQQQQLLNEIAYEEQQHVRFLRSALGGLAVPMPTIDLTFFGPLAAAAGVAGGSSFSPFASWDAFLIGAFIFEDVGVTAYLGAAPLLTPAAVTGGFLNAAAGILAVEAYHAATIRTQLTARAVAAGATTNSPTDPKYPYVGIANQVEALRASLTVGTSSGAPSITNNTGNNGTPNSAASVEVPLTVPTSLTSLSTIVPADSKNALAFARNVNQVHHIVYGSATVGVSKGGFFPNGTNSAFATTTA